MSLVCFFFCIKFSKEVWAFALLFVFSPFRLGRPQGFNVMASLGGDKTLLIPGEGELEMGLSDVFA